MNECILNSHVNKKLQIEKGKMKNANAIFQCKLTGGAKKDAPKYEWVKWGNR
jgi:hypothetical protein